MICVSPGNILAVGRQSDTLNGQVGKHKTAAKVAVACETSTPRGAAAQLEFPCL
jgi:hypothetical protein